jgi:hypothetical protein
MTLEDFELKSINETFIKKISSEYLSAYESDLLFLLLKGRRTKELGILLNTPPCEIVRRRKVISRKVRVIYQYHFKRDPIAFLKYAVRFLDPIKFQCLVHHIWALNPLKVISKKFKIQPSTVQRWLQQCKTVLENTNIQDEHIKEFMGCFDEMPYLGVQEIRRPKKENKAFNSIKLGSKTLGGWLGALHE